MEWTRSTTLALASPHCALCHGLGMGGTDLEAPCDCVLRSIFRICHERFTEYATDERHLSRVRFSIHSSGPNRRGTWSRTEEEYMADFILIARRTLNERDFRLFRFRFLLGADWRLCGRKLGMDRGTCFNRIYSIQKRVGRALAEAEPYALFPLSEYFFTPHRLAPVQAFIPNPVKVVPIRPPVPIHPEGPRETDEPVRNSA
jgi:hypothetical protein